jgi:hypothetical protein
LLQPHQLLFYLENLNIGNLYHLSFGFDEENASSSSYRKEIAHMARYYRLHLGSFLAIEFAKELDMYPQSYKDNLFESAIELHKARWAYYMFDFAMNSNKTMEKKIVTPILMDCDYEENARERKGIGIHIYGDENIRSWKRWGDGYQGL